MYSFAISIKPKLPTPIQHVKLFAAPLFLILISFMIFYSSHLDPICIPLIVTCNKVLALHVIFLIDYEAHGNSKKSMVKQQALNIIANLSLPVSIYFNVYSENIFIYNLVAAVIFSVEFLYFLSIGGEIDELPTVEHHSPHLICKICRKEFGEAPVKKLLCEHYYHAECISKWAKRNHNCSICNQIRTSEFFDFYFSDYYY